MNIKRTGTEEALQLLTHQNGVKYLRFPDFDIENNSDFSVKHAFSTRLGGVSKGCFSSMNLSYTRGDIKENVDENYRRMTEIFSSKIDDVVCTYQTHTVNIRKVSLSDKGKGTVKERDYTDIDALICNERGIILSVYMADCVPLLFIDPENKAIGAAHSGWRGSVNGMAKEVLFAMRAEFGTDPGLVKVAIGPSISADCYEVGEDVASQVLSGSLGIDLSHILIPSQKEGKYLLHLWELNRALLLEQGVKSSNIFVSDICTRSNPELLFSHRAHGDERGNMAAMIKIMQHENKR